MIQKQGRCNELVARTPDVILETGEPQDYTHLQKCGAPATRNGKCYRHRKRPNEHLDARWRRFLSRQA